MALTLHFFGTLLIKTRVYFVYFKTKFNRVMKKKHLITEIEVSVETFFASFQLN
jgi:hypothetical protein